MEQSEIELFRTIIQHVMLTGIVVFFIQAIYGYKNFKIHNEKLGLKHTMMCLSAGFYSLSYYLGTLNSSWGIGLEILYGAFIFAFSAFYFYLDIVNTFLKLRSPFIKITKSVFLCIIIVNIIDFFMGILFSNYLMFSEEIPVYKTAIGNIVDPKRGLSIFGKLVCGVGMLGVIISSSTIFFMIKKRHPEEKMLLYGVAISFFVGLHDLVMGFGIWFYMLPLTYFGYIFEVFRFGSHFQKRAIIKIQQLKGELSRVAQAAQVGYVAASITHDVKNPLTVMTFATGILKKNEFIENDEKMSSLLNKITNQIGLINRVIEMYTGLMYNQSEVVFEDVNLCQAIKAAEELAQKQTSEYSVNIINEVSDDILVKGNINVLMLSLTNLFNNSCQAIGEQELAERWIRVEFKDNTLSVIDSGDGIPSEIADKIFDMQFTTKSKERGTGLGLVKELLLQYDISIKVDTSYDKTKFDISFSS